MKSQKNIALLCSLLLWAALLCLSGYIKAAQLRTSDRSHISGKSHEQLTAEEHPGSVAWSEQAAPQASAHLPGYIIPFPTQDYGLLRFPLLHLTRKPDRTARGFFSFSGQFRILPNAP